MHSAKSGRAKVVAEIGCNHRGDLEVAKQLVTVAASYCAADAVKFQKRCPRELLTPEQYAAPHPNPVNSYGESYGAHREFLELDVEQHRELKALCDQLGIDYGCSVWDLTSAKDIASLDPSSIKIPSACNNHRPMLTWLCENYQGSIHVSLGMTTQAEEKALVELFREHKRMDSLVLYSCTSGYPVDPRDLCLLEISRLQQQYSGEVQAVGFSGHHLGVAMDIAAATLGAGWIERHFTMDRRWKGTDHGASLEPQDLHRLVSDLSDLAAALSAKPQEILDIEAPQRDKLKWRASGDGESSAA